MERWRRGAGNHNLSDHQPFSYHDQLQLLGAVLVERLVTILFTFIRPFSGITNVPVFGVKEWLFLPYIECGLVILVTDD